MVDAQTFINTHFIDKTITKITNQDLIDKGITTPGGLTGPLKLVGFTKLKKIEINDAKKIANGLDNDLTKLIIVNCPELEEIDVKSNKLTKLDITKIKTDDDSDTGEPAPADKLKKMSIGGNADLEKVSLEYCPKLESFVAPGNIKMDKIPGMDKLKNLGSVAIEGNLIGHIVSEKLDYYKNVVKVVRKIMGKGPNEDLPKDGSGKLIPKDLEDGIMAGAGSQLQTKLDQAEKERDTAKAQLDNQKDYEEIKTERDQLKQQLTAIRSELGLTESSTKEQVIDKIKELMKRPTSSCSHTDYDTIKAERDRLKTENTKLKNDNKEN